MSIDLALNVAPGLLGDELYFTTSAITIAPGVGSELLANGSFGAWTGDNPDGWSVSETPPDREVTQRDPGQGHADTMTVGGAANLYYAGGPQPVISESGKLAIGNWYRAAVNVTRRVGGFVYAEDSGVGLHVKFGAAGAQTWTGRASGTAWQIYTGDTGSDITIDDASVKLLSNTYQLFTHPKATGDFSIHFTASAGYQAGIVFNWQDANNFMRLYFDRLDDKVHLIKRLSGTETEIGAWSAVYAAAQTLIARRHRDGTLDAIYNGVTLASGLAAAGLAGLQAGPFLTDVGQVTIHRYIWNGGSVS